MEPLLQIVKTGLKRRKKETRMMRIISWLTVLFLAGTLLLQDNMEVYQRQINYRNYGEWIFCQPDIQEGESGLSHPYLGKKGVMVKGTEIYNLDREETGAAFGWFDENLLKMGHIGLYKGRMPRQKNEIVMEYSLLAKMKCNYTLGSKISFYYRETEMSFEELLDENATSQKPLRKATFVLTGILKNYTGRWEGGSMYPNALVSRSGFESMGVTSSRSVFYSLKEQYQDISTEGLFEKFQSDLQRKNNRQGVENWNALLYNGEKFQDNFWGDARLYHSIELILLGIGAALLSYLMSIFMDNRRTSYFRLREMGATAKQIRVIALYECFRSVVLFTTLGVVCGYLLTGGINLFFTKTLNIKYFFEFRWGTLGKILLDMVIALAVSIIAAQIYLGAGRIQENTILIRGKRLRRLQKMTKSRRYRFQGVEKDFLHRQRKIYRLQTWMVRGVIMAVTMIALFCLTRIQETYSIYQDVRVAADASAYAVEKDWKMMEYDKDDWGEAEWGISEAICEELRNIQGIQHLVFQNYDMSHVFDWKGKEHSEFLKKVAADVNREYSEKPAVDVSQENTMMEMDDYIKDTNDKFQFLSEMEFILYGSQFYEKAEDLLEVLEGDVPSEHLDKERLEQGKDVVVGINIDAVCHTSEFYLSMEEEEASSKRKEEREKKNSWKENTLHSGDTIQIKTNSGMVEATVAAIVYITEETEKTEATMDYHVEENPPCLYNLFGCQELGKRVADADGREYRPNAVKIYQNPMSDYAGVQEQLAGLFNESGIDYTSDTFVYESWQDMLQTVCLYSTFGIVVVALFLMIAACIIQERMARRYQEENLLRRLGMEQKGVNRMHFREGVQECIWVWICVPFYLFLSLLYKGNRLGLDMMYDDNFYNGIIYSYRLKKNVEITSQWQAAWERLPCWTSPWLCILCLLILSISILLLYLHSYHDKVRVDRMQEVE
ncbi:MAG: ABC transporter permease [Lachnospiraceae bacterium]|nr:ABC transporter permease [Lachnospiraceae bacterium]